MGSVVFWGVLVRRTYVSRQRAGIMTVPSARRDVLPVDPVPVPGPTDLGG